MRLVQFELSNGQRRVGLVDGDQVREVQVGETHDYLQLLKDLRILPPLDHPDPAHLLVSGTGLTHLGSASARDKMHQQSGDEASMTDTMRIFMGRRRRQASGGADRCAAGVVL